MGKTYELPLTRNYCANWGMKESLREFIQNAIDSESPFQYEYNPDLATLRIISRFATLPVHTLLLGMTSKAGNDSKIGSFGEGYKIAMLVLTRMNHKVRIYNDGVVWTPHFAYSKQFQHETLHVAETKAGRGEPYEGVVFEIHDIFGNDMAEIRGMALQMQSMAQIGPVIHTPLGQILCEKPGAIYVGGLYITTHNDFKYGYNFNPDQVSLERDRQTINGWDLYSATKNMWFATEGHMHTIVQMIEEEAVDMHYANYNTPQIVKDAIYTAFIEKYPNSVPVTSQKELKEYIDRGINNVVYVGVTHGDMLLSHSEVKQRTQLALYQPPPVETLTAWYDQLECKLLTDHDRKSWEDLLKAAESWKVK